MKVGNMLEISDVIEMSETVKKIATFFYCLKEGINCVYLIFILSKCVA